MSQLPVKPEDLLAGFKRAAARQELAGPDGDFHYLKLDKSGTWLYGADEIEVEEDSRWAINPATLATGFAAWKDNEKVGEEMAPLSGEPVSRSQLPDVGAPWAAQTAMQLKCVSGEDEGSEVIYSTTSKGGQKMFKTILAVITARLDSGDVNVIPIVTMEVSSYKHKKYGKIFTPELKVVDWMGLTPVAAQDDPEPEVEAEPEAEAEAEAKPARRRRKRA